MDTTSATDSPHLLQLHARFPDVDRALLYLALADPHQPLPTDVAERLRTQYGFTSYQGQPLLYYGDALIGSFFAQRLRRTNPLGMSLAQLDHAHANLVQVARNQIPLVPSGDVCKRTEGVRLLSLLSSTSPMVLPVPGAPSSPVTITAPANSRINIQTPGTVNPAMPSFSACSMSVSAIVGALFVQYGLERAKDIYEWFDSVISIDQTTASGGGPAAATPATGPRLDTSGNKWSIPTVTLPAKASLSDVSNALYASSNNTYRIFLQPIPGQDAVAVNIINTQTQLYKPLGTFTVAGLARATSMTNGTLNIPAGPVAQILQTSGVWKVQG